MNSLNSILLEGNLTADPEYLETKGGNKLCTFSIACDRFFKQDDEYQKEVSFFNVTVLNRLAETFNNKFKKLQRFIEV